MPGDWSETAKFRHLTTRYCAGSGVDIGSGGDPVVPWAIQVELPIQTRQHYNQGDSHSHFSHHAPVQLEGDGRVLEWFRSMTLDFCYASHLLEDFHVEAWPDILLEWMRVVKPGGYLVILIPDKVKWAEALAAGQPPNDAHKHEGTPGELTGIVSDLASGSWEILRDSLVPDSYTILFVARRK